jgi:PAS domain S-box-containing protein
MIVMGEKTRKPGKPAHAADIPVNGSPHDRGQAAAGFDLRSIIDASPLAITLLDGEGRVMDWSRMAESVFGWSAGEVLGRVPPFVSQEKMGEFRIFHGQAMEGRSLSGIRITRNKKDGSAVDLSMSIAPVRDSSGRIAGVLGFFADITGHLRQEKALLDSEDRYRTIVQNLQGIAYRLKGDYSPIYYHGDSVMVCGRTSEDLMKGSPTWLEMVMEAERPVFRDFMEAARAEPGKQVHLRYWIHCPDGTDRFIYQLMRFIQAGDGAGGYFDGFIYDTTADKLKELQLTEVSQELNSTFNALYDGILITDLNGKIIRCNNSAARLLGAAEADMVGGDISLHLYDRGATSVEDPLFLVKRTMKRESVVLSWDDKYFGVRVDPFRNPFGEMVGAVHVVSEITTRIRAEEEVRRVNETLGAIVAGSPLAIITFDVRGRVKSWNRAAEMMFGWTESEALGQVLPEVPEQEAAASMERWNESLAGHPKSNIKSTRVRKDGSFIRLLSSHAVMRNSSGAVEGLLVLALDITEQENMEKAVRQRDVEVRQLQKMEAIGRLAGGMAHDFNNILTAILGYGDLLLGKINNDSPLRKNAEEIVKAAGRAADLASHLLTFSRKKMYRNENIDLNLLVDDTAPMVRQIAGENITVRIAKGAGSPVIDGNSGLLQQVLVNLAINSCEVMPAGGLLVIETDVVTMDGDYSSRHPGALPGEYAVLSVSDTGTGMDEEQKAHLFEPFYTTKESGTGLGLSTAYGIVSQMNGHFSVYSEKGRGTTFKVYFPLSKSILPGAAPRIALTSGGEIARGGTETVLVVEDQEDVKMLACRVLQGAGYRVLSASGGEEALRMALQTEGPIDLLLTDLVMPGMDGQEVASKIALQRPATKILMMSGYTDTVLSARNMIEQGAAFLQKPFTAHRLVEKVREVLDGNSRD